MYVTSSTSGTRECLSLIMISLMSDKRFIMNMNESFSLYDLEHLDLENQAKIPNKDDITVCSCRGMCMRQKG